MTLNRIKFDEDIKKEKGEKNEKGNDKILRSKILYSEEKNEKRRENGDEKTKKGGEMKDEKDIIEKDIVQEWDKKIKEAYYLWEKYGAEIPEEKFTEFQDGMRDIPKFMKFKAKMTSSVLAGSYRELGDTELLNILFGKGSDGIVKKANVLIEATGFKPSSQASLISNLSNLHKKFSVFLKGAEDPSEEDEELGNLKRADFEILDWLIEKVDDNSRGAFLEEYLTTFTEYHTKEAEEFDSEFDKPKTKEDANKLIENLEPELNIRFQNIKASYLDDDIYQDTAYLEREIISLRSLDKQIALLKEEAEYLPLDAELLTFEEQQREIENKYDTGKMEETEYSEANYGLIQKKESRKLRLQAQIALREAKKLSDEIITLKNELKNTPSKKEAKKENIKDTIEEKTKRREIMENIADKLLDKAKIKGGKK